MTRNESFLNHHEELRLDYLEKNIHYLNEKEQQELAYLRYRAKGYELPAGRLPSRSSRTSRPISSQEESILPEYRDEDYGRSEFYSSERANDSVLPEYPREERRRRPRKSRPSRPRPERLERPERPERFERPKRPKPSRAPRPVPVEERAPKVKRPRKKVSIKRVIKWVLLGLLAIILGMVVMFVKGYVGVPSDQKGQAEVFHGEDTADGVNILILGTDGRKGDVAEATRTDSIMVLNINNKDKKVKMVSFMRDTLINIEGNPYKLNLAYTLGEQDGQQGAEGVRQALKANFDINIKHYALVDFATFGTAIDTLFPNGVKMNAKFGTINGEEVTSVEAPNDIGFGDQSTPYQTIHVGEQYMNGQTLLNYARFRGDDEVDFGRTRRQQEVMAAILSQIKDPTKLFTGSEAAGKVLAMTSTSIPTLFTVTNGIPAAFDGMGGVVQTTVPENGDWVEAYDIYDGLGLEIDFEKYKAKLDELGFR